MRKSTIVLRFIPALVIVCLMIVLISVSRSNDTSADTMRLSMHEGTVTVIGPSNMSQNISDNMEILSGNHIVTDLSSYAWINLDDTKLVKMDALSEIQITKDNKDLTVDVLSGKIFLDVSKHLKNDESLTICTSNTSVSIVGTSVEVSVYDGKTQILCLDGKIKGFAIDEKSGQNTPIEIAGGKIVSVENTGSGLNIESNTATKEDISGFAKLQIAQDPVLKKRIVNAMGTEGDIDLNEATASLQQDTIRQTAEVEANAKAEQAAINTTPSKEEASSDDSAKTPTPDIGENATPISAPVTIPPAPGAASPQNDDYDDDDDEEKIHIHAWVLVETQKEATCVEEGAVLYKCQTCLETKTDVVATIAHSFTEGSTTRIVEGESSYNCTEIEIGEYRYCSSCKQEIEVSRYQKYTSHDLHYEDQDTVHATCNSDTKITYHCRNQLDANRECTYNETRIIEDERPDHILGEEQSSSNPNHCKMQVCSVCDFTVYTEHVKGDEDTLPTTYNGTQYIKCKNCEKYAEYAWDESSGKYIFSDNWTASVP